MKHYCPDGVGLYQDDNAATQRAGGLTEWLYDNENDVIHSQTPDFICGRFCNHHQNKSGKTFYKNWVYPSSGEVLFQKCYVFVYKTSLTTERNRMKK